MTPEIRCSKLSRVMSCAGSLFFTDLHEQDEGQPAKEGTAAGEYLELLLTKGLDAEATFPTTAKNGVAFDHDMKFYTRPIAEEILTRANGQVLCETRIDWTTISGVPIRGQYDASYLTDGGQTLVIDDLKYGWGIVEVKNNWQLLGYAIGEVMRRGMAFQKIQLRIHQPRPHHEDGTTRIWDLTYEELLGYKDTIDQRMATIFTNGDHSLVTGSQCKYCPAAAERCPAFGRTFYNTIETSMEFLQDGMNEQELAQQLTLVQRMTEILKIKKDSLEALAKDRIKNNVIIPGWTTEASYSDRKWKSSVTPKSIELLTGKKIIKEEMLSPAQAEKLGIPKDFVNSLIDRHYLGHKLVRKDSGQMADKVFGNK